MVKITALMVVKDDPQGSDPVILTSATDLSSFGFFQRPSVKEFIIFVGRTVAKRTPPGQRQSVQHEATNDRVRVGSEGSEGTKGVIAFKNMVLSCQKKRK